MAHKEREIRDVSELTLVVSLVQFQVVEILSKRMTNNNLIIQNFLELSQNQSGNLDLQLVQSSGKMGRASGRQV